MGAGRRRVGEAGWREILGAWEASGQSVAAFCRREGLVPGNFYRWKRRLGNGALQRGSSRGKVQTGGADGPKTFLPVAVRQSSGEHPASPGAGRLAILTAQGARVEVGADFDAETLGRLLDLLERRAC